MENCMRAKRRVDIISVNREKNYVYVVSYSAVQPTDSWTDECCNDQWNLSDFESKLGVTFVRPEYDFLTMYIDFEPLSSRC